MYNRLSGGILKKVTPTTVENMVRKKCQAYAGFKICYPRMPLLDLFAERYPRDVSVYTQAIVDREGTA